MKKIISSAQNSKIKETAKLKNLKYSKESNKFLIEGFHLLDMALKSDNLLEVYSTKELNLPDKIENYVVNDIIIEKLSNLKTSQGVVGVCSYFKEKPLTSNSLVYLDNIKDPGNMGTILRTCLAFGYHDVLVSENCVSIYNDKVIMSSQGAIFNLNIVKCDYEKLKNLKQNYKIYASTLSDKSVEMDSITKMSDKNIIVFGNESTGISNEIISLADYFYKIDISEIDSLNVGVAAGVSLHYFRKITN